MQIVDPDNKEKIITFSSTDKASSKILIVAGTIWVFLLKEWDSLVAQM